MGCIRVDGSRCTKCCEVTHIDKKFYFNYLNNKFTLSPTNEKLFGKDGYWTRISPRRAKKINPYIFTKDGGRELKQIMVFFTCNKLIKGVGCALHGSTDKPEVCEIYEGGDDYSITCREDYIRILD